MWLYLLYTSHIRPSPAVANGPKPISPINPELKPKGTLRSLQAGIGASLIMAWSEWTLKSNLASSDEETSHGFRVQGFR